MVLLSMFACGTVLPHDLLVFCSAIHYAAGLDLSLTISLAWSVGLLLALCDKKIMSDMSGRPCMLAEQKLIQCTESVTYCIR